MTTPANTKVQQETICRMLIEANEINLSKYAVELTTTPNSSTEENQKRQFLKFIDDTSLEPSVKWKVTPPSRGNEDLALQYISYTISAYHHLMLEKNFQLDDFCLEFNSNFLPFETETKESTTKLKNPAKTLKNPSKNIKVISKPAEEYLNQKGFELEYIIQNHFAGNDHSLDHRLIAHLLHQKGKVTHALLQLQNLKTETISQARMFVIPQGIMPLEIVWGKINGVPVRGIGGTLEQAFGVEGSFGCYQDIFEVVEIGLGVVVKAEDKCSC